ncbi:MAG: class D beta-lactamase [Rhizobiaceae bacterium]
MHNFLRIPSTFLIILVFLIATIVAANAEERIERSDLAEIFERQNIEGTFVLYDVSSDRLILVNAARAAVQKFPASTFKVANSLIALETSVVKDENEIIPYDGKPQLIKSWEHDMSMRDAIKISNVPIYQELARRIGIDNYGKWLGLLNYGNTQIGMDVETFWLQGPLKINAIEQVNFLAKLANKKLPLSSRSQSIVRDILKQEQKNNKILFAKTGWSSAPTPQIGWYVGWVESKDGLFTFALNIDISSRADARKRKAIAKTLLNMLGIY